MHPRSPTCISIQGPGRNVRDPLTGLVSYVPGPLYEQKAWRCLVHDAKTLG